MADDTILPGAGELISTDELTSVNGVNATAGLKVQRVKVGYGPDGSLQDATPDAPLPVAAYGELVEAIEAMRFAMQALTRSMGQMQPDTAARMRVALDSISVGLTLAAITAVGTVTTVTTVATLANQTQIGGLSATEQIPSLMRLGADSLRRNITTS